MTKGFQYQMLTAMFSICAILCFRFGFKGEGYIFYAVAYLDFCIGCYFFFAHEVFGKQLGKE